MLQIRMTFFMLLFSLFLISCVSQKPSSSIPTPLQTQSPLSSLSSSTRVLLRNNKGELVEVFVELAKTDQERQQGLMNRTDLGEQQGMLFLFPEVTNESFWMKNTLIPLDIIFLDDTKKIVTIHEADPCKADPCRTYGSGKPIKYVLEVQKGFTKAHQISIGDEVLF